MRERSIEGERMTGGTDRPSRSFGRDRVCREDGCRTVLSIYNNGRYCAQHEPMSVPRTRGRKIA